MTINDIHTYTLKIHGLVEEGEINSSSPVQVAIDQVEETFTLITLQTDQSGIIGLLRHLHGLGLVLISMSCSVANLPDIDSEHSARKP